jgi:hypothetical protein
MSESDFGRQYYSIFGAVKDNVSNRLTEVCLAEGLSPDVTKRIVATANSSVEQISTNAYSSLWRAVLNSFRSE